MFLVARFPIFFIASSYSIYFHSNCAKYSRNLPVGLSTRFLLLPFFSCFFSRTLSWKRSLFFFLFALYKTFLSFSRETPYSSSCLSVRRSFCKPAGRKRPATLLSRHCLSEQTAWSCLRAK